VPWDQLSGLPALENPDEPLPLPETDTDDGPRDDGPHER
jgi:hypothetical protein